MKFIHFLTAISVVAIWGANAAFGKLAVMQIPPMAFLSFRFLLTGIIFLPFAKLKKGELKHLFKIALIFNVFHYSFIFTSMQFLDASALVLIMQSQVPIAIFLSWFIFDEKLTLKNWIGILLALLGLTIIFGIPNLNIVGFLLAILGCILWAISTIEMKKLQKINLPAFMAYSTILSVPFLCILSFIFEDNIIEKTFSANWFQISAVLAYQIILGCYAMMAWQRLMVLNDVNKITPISLLQPLFGITAGFIIFNETITYKMLTGGVITTIGVALTVIKRSKKIKDEIMLT